MGEERRTVWMYWLLWAAVTVLLCLYVGGYFLFCRAPRMHFITMGGEKPVPVIFFNEGAKNDELMWCFFRPCIWFDERFGGISIFHVDAAWSDVRNRAGE